MFLACDMQGEIVHADNAKKGAQYKCWACNGRVVLKRGSIKISHFAHESNCECNGWTYRPMTQWHRDMQQYFSLTEVPMEDENTGERHIADAVAGGKEKIVFEFQHSSISADEVQRRTNFYLNLGYRVVWIYDASEKICPKKTENPSIYQLATNVFAWKSPFKFFQHLPLHQLQDRVRILFYWKTYDSFGNIVETLNTVCWTPLSEQYNNRIEDYSPDFRVFAVSNQIVLASDTRWPIHKIFQPFCFDFRTFEKLAKEYLDRLNSYKPFLNTMIYFRYYRPHHKRLQIRLLSDEEKWIEKLRDIVSKSEGNDEIVIIDTFGNKHICDSSSSDMVSNRIRYDFDVFETIATTVFSTYFPTDDYIKWI